MIENKSWSGGCQCGHVRYRFSVKPANAHVCHCRMCQKALGHFFAAYVSAPLSSFEITRGELSVFRSSGKTERGFCRDCGTPLSIHDDGETSMFVTIGSLDHPEEFPPLEQCGVESRLPYVNGVGRLPDRPATEDEEPEGAAAIAASNHQHPDHDTAIWPETSALK